MKIKIIKSFRPNPHKGPLEVGNELEVRLLPGSPFNLYRPYQVVEGRYSGEEVPITHCVLLPEEKSYTEQQYTSLKQENLQRLEEVKGLQRQVQSLTNFSNQKAKDVRRLNDDASKAWAAYNAERESRVLLEATLERAMLDHQPVVLPKEVAEAIKFYKDYFNEADIYQLGCDGTDGKYATVINNWLKQNGSKSAFMFALVNSYTVEEIKTPEDMVLNYFNTITPKDWEYTGNGNDPVYIERNAIRTTCYLLGKTIDGMNSK